MKYVVAILCMLALIGCYHATILTGATPSTETIEQSWAACWIYGLVPPSTVAAQEKCVNGVAKVETQLSFLNQLVGGLTLGIYTPMEIKVTCAAKGSSSLKSDVADIVLPPDATQQQIVEAFSRAADLAVKEHRPVYVDY